MAAENKMMIHNKLTTIFWVKHSLVPEPREGVAVWVRDSIKMEVILCCFVLVLVTGMLRFVYLYTQFGRDGSARKRKAPCRTMIVVGAGGHAMEMFKLLTGIDFNHYSPRHYVVARNDTMSREKIESFESPRAADISVIMRAREVGQSYISSVGTTLGAVINSLPLILMLKPDLLLCNGPGTCVPVCLAAYFIKYIGLKDIKIVYAESLCRVEHLSLSALMLYKLAIANEVVVQWPQLARKYPKTKYCGRMI